MLRPRSLGWPITLGVIMIVLLVGLIVGWVLLSTEKWTVLALGTTFLAIVLVGVVFYLILSVKEIRLNQRQSNFIDSVTHELKSPIASLKLYLQTLSRRNLPEEQQADFVRFMLEDVDRLGILINHLLDAAWVEHVAEDRQLAQVDLGTVLENCARMACLRYRVPEESVRLDVDDVVVWAPAMDVEMVFRNLIDNAIKYSHEHPEVQVQAKSNGKGTVVTRISDNGPGIPAKLRRKIFGRFVRLGSELERSKPGTGLGLFIVRTLVKRMKGKVSVRGRGAQSGTIFEVELPGKSVTAPNPLSV